MVNPRSSLPLVALGLASSLGCLDILGLTPGNPDPTGGGGTGGSSTTSTPTTAGEGGTTTTTSIPEGGAGGAGGNGGAGGGCTRECISTAPCKDAVCIDGQCTLVPMEAGTLVGDPVSGDCQAKFCDGRGEVITAAYFDPDDGNECTWDTCLEAIAGHLPRRAGTHCGDGEGVCEEGQCVVTPCAPPDGVPNGNETDTDCGGACDPCPLGGGCRVTADCQTGLFCASGTCTEPVLLAMITTSVGLQAGTFKPGATPSDWDLTDFGEYNSATAAGITFDSAGEAVAITRAGSSGARACRWTAGVWTPPKGWPLSSSGWLPVFARTDPALYVFVQDSNAKHQYSIASAESGAPFQVLPGASSPLSGGAGTRQGHASFFHAPVDAGGHLLETRLLGGLWSKTATVLEGNYADSQPAMVPIATGDLLVAARRDDSKHVFDWRVLTPQGPGPQGTLPNILFGPNQPVPRRFALAPLANGGAILAYRANNGALDVRIATDDGAGGVTWSPQNVYPSPPIIAGEPALAKGLPGTRAELVYIAQGNSKLRHVRLLENDTWTAPVDLLNTEPTTINIGSVGIATP